MISGAPSFTQAEYIQLPGNSFTLALYSAKVKAGFPSPADDYIDTQLDLNQYLIKHPAATFFVRASSNSMVSVGIFKNDLLIVDRSLEAVPGKVVIAVIHGELTVKRFYQSSMGYFLLSDDSQCTPLKLNGYCDVSIWGVVTSVIHHV